MPKQKSTPPTVEATLRGFCVAQRAAGRAPRTIGLHVEGISLLSPKLAVKSITPHDVRLVLANPRWSNSTRLIRHKSLRAFFAYCEGERIIKTSPMLGFQAPRGEKARRPPVYTADDVKALLDACPSWTWLGLRDRALLTVLATMPARLSEITGMRVDDIDWTDMSVELRGKGGVIYQAILFPDCAAAIDRYLRARSGCDLPELWVSQTGEPLSKHGIHQLLKRLQKRAGLSKPLYAHAFRHNFGMRTVAWGLATDEAMHAMGHRSDAATKIYRQWVTRDAALEKIRRIAAAPAPVPALRGADSKGTERNV